MDRRKFLKTAAGSALINPGAFAGLANLTSPAPAGAASEKFPPSAFTRYTALGHRRRLQNIEIWKAYQAHPDGPYSYGWWDSVPGRPNAQRTHAEWLARYAPMVEEGSWAWLQVDRSELFAAPRPPNVVASVFANRAIYLVLANYGHDDVSLETREPYVSLNPRSISATRHWSLAPRSLLMLKKT